MRHQNLKPELLAPAGTIEAFFAAIENGADAVYVGLKSLNARALARNFSLKEVHLLLQHAHKAGRKIFVAMNSLAKEDEIPEAIEMLSTLEAMGIDGIIIQDLGIWRLARRYFPGLRLHASTLMTIHNSLGVKQAHEMGFKRVVLAREMTLREIKDAADAAPVEIEVFIHGAMCFTYSGLCLFSSFFGGNASTRGRCVQPCRRRFLIHSRPGSYFSMGDLCALDALDELKKIGITSLKIEGRLRPPSYVATVVKAYRMALDAGADDREALNEARKLLREDMGRRATRGYFFSQSPPDAISPQLAANTGRYLGKVVKEEGGRLLVSGKDSPEQGSRIRFVLRNEDEQGIFICLNTEAGTEQDTFWITGNASSNKVKKGVLLFMADTSKDGKYKALKAIPDQCSVFSNILKKSREKLNEILFSLKKKTIIKKIAGSGLFLKAGNLKDIHLLKGLKYNGIILEITGNNIRSMGKEHMFKQERTEVIWSLPPIIHEARIPFYRNSIKKLLKMGFTGFQAGNLSHLQFFKDRASSRRRIHLLGNYTLNLLNSQAVLAATDLGVDAPQISMETDRENAKAILSYLKDAPLSITVFAYPPLFTSRQHYGTLGKNAQFVSPKGETFYWKTGKEEGRLFPARPFSLMRLQKELKQMGFQKMIVDITYLPPALKPGRDWSGRSFNFNDRLK